MPKGDKNTGTGNRPTMGTSVASTVNARQPEKGRATKKSGNAKGGMLEAATAAHRAGIQEREGASYAPRAILYAANAPEAAQTQRNVVTVPSAAGNRDFYLNRRYGQGY